MNWDKKAVLILIIAVLVSFMGGRMSVKPKIIKEEVIPADKQCYNTPLELDKICHNFFEAELNTKQIEFAEKFRQAEEALRQTEIKRQFEFEKALLQLEIEKARSQRDGYVEGLRAVYKKAR